MSQVSAGNTEKDIARCLLFTEFIQLAAKFVIIFCSLIRIFAGLYLQILEIFEMDIV